MSAEITYTPLLTESLIHARVDAPFVAGRLSRQGGQLLCAPRRESVAWTGIESPDAEITCPKCRKMLRLETKETT